MLVNVLKGLRRMLGLLATIWRLPQKHENSRLLLTVASRLNVV